jgi:hypothetical protein
MFDARNIKPAAAMHMSSSSSVSLKRHMMYSLNCRCQTTVDSKKQTKISRISTRIVGSVVTTHLAFQSVRMS